MVVLSLHNTILKIVSSHVQNNQTILQSTPEQLYDRLILKNEHCFIIISFAFSVSQVVLVRSSLLQTADRVRFRPLFIILCVDVLTTFHTQYLLDSMLTLYIKQVSFVNEAF